MARTRTKLLWSPLLVMLSLSVCNAASSSVQLQLTGTSLESSAGAPSSGSSVVFDIDNYGAHGDRKHHDTKALGRAWKAACSSPRPAVLLVPRGNTYRLKPVTLSGPCRSSVVFMVQGTLVAPRSRSAWSDKNRRHWIVLQRVAGLTVTGGGTINGRGKIWWKKSCKANKAFPCKGAPTALTLRLCSNLKVENLNIVNSQQIHLSVEDCRDVQLAGLSITAPGTSPNTDGIHITHSKDVQVRDCLIKTGDDCISIESGTHNLHVSRVVCGPGHGISVGSLGDDNSRAEVSRIYIDTVRLYGTTNGARIKTWQGGSGYAKDIVFQNMVMDSVQNPIIIDQNYCDSAKPCKNQTSAVEVSNVVFRNIRGTTVSKDAIKLSCSKDLPCSDIALENINLKLEGGSGDTESTCQNAEWRKSGNVFPLPCKGKN
uniref:Uncharacterized protein n=1 Tax=Avena sativa TaxID=4498 RepID=A0ACD5XA32_AVESA